VNRRLDWKVIEFILSIPSRDLRKVWSLEVLKKSSWSSVGVEDAACGQRPQS